MVFGLVKRGKDDGVVYPRKVKIRPFDTEATSIYKAGMPFISVDSTGTGRIVVRLHGRSSGERDFLRGFIMRLIGGWRVKFERVRKPDGLNVKMLLRGSDDSSILVDRVVRAVKRERFPIVILHDSRIVYNSFKRGVTRRAKG